MRSDEEEKHLRIAALKNAEEILLARNRAEEALRTAKIALEHSNRQLQQQRELLQVTLSSIGDAVITTDTSGRVTFLNPIAEAMTGWSAAEAVGEPLDTVFQIVNELTLAPVQHPVERVLRDNVIVELANHTSLLSRHGIATPIEDSAAPIRDTNGNLTGAVMVFHDVTARRKTEAALSESELRFRTIFNQAAVGIAVTDLMGRLTQANQKFADTFGYSISELSQRTFLQLTHKSDVPETEEHLHRLVTGQLSDVVLEKRCLHKSGRVIWTISTITLIKDPSGRPQHLLGLVEDITSRKLAEEAQARLVAVIASSDDSIISMTLDGTVLSWNRGAEQMYGYAESEMLGRTTAELIPLDRPNEETLILERIRQGERIEHFETVRRRRDGTLLSVSIGVSPIEDARGEIIGASKITRDITEKKRTEGALREMDRRKDEFLATLAHELRNPLAPIRQAALLAKMPSATDAQKRWSQEVIDRQVLHMSVLLDDLLDISRVTRGTLELRLAPVDIGAVIDAAVETARPSIEAKRHELSIEKPATASSVVADPIRLAQVLSNLLTNAAKYTDPQGAIELRAVTTDHEVVVSVKDSGIGLAPDTLSTLFEMFTQVKMTPDRSEGGLGIGLALSKGLVELHGGRIDAQSAGLGLGSEFIVYLPRGEASITPPQLSGVATGDRLVRHRILIADDNRDAAASLSMLLEFDGHQLCVTHDGPAALQAFSQFNPEVALLDIGMPGLNGYEVARLARKAAAGRPLVLIALTGWGQERDKQQAIEAGFNYHFTKPVNPDQITEILRTL